MAGWRVSKPVTLLQSLPQNNTNHKKVPKNSDLPVIPCQQSISKNNIWSHWSPVLDKQKTLISPCLHSPRLRWDDMSLLGSSLLSWLIHISIILQWWCFEFKVPNWFNVTLSSLEQTDISVCESTLNRRAWRKPKFAKGLPNSTLPRTRGTLQQTWYLLGQCLVE